MNTKLLIFFVFCFVAFSFSAEYIIDQCPENVIKSFKGLEYVMPRDLSSCDLTLGVSSFMESSIYTGSSIYASDIYYPKAIGEYTRIKPSSTLGSAVVYFNIDWENLNINFSSTGARIPYKVSTELDTKNPSGTGINAESYINYYNETHIVMFRNAGASSEYVYIQFANATYESNFLYLVLENYNYYITEPQRTGSNINSTSGIDLRGGVDYRRTFDESPDPEQTYIQYSVTDGSSANHVGYLMGVGNPLKNFIVSTPSSYKHNLYRTYTNGLCSAYIVGDEELIYPQLTYTPFNSGDSDGSGFAMASWYNPDYYYSYFWNNTATYIMDEYYGYWWFVPAFECDSYTTPITVTALRLGESALGDGELGGEWSLPVIPTQQTCYYDGTNYSVLTKTPSSVSHLLQVTWLNGTNTTVSTEDSETTKSYAYTFNVSTYSNISEINYYIGDNLKCKHDFESKSIFGISTLEIPEGYDWLTFTIFILIIAISIYTPYFIVFGIVWNDLFTLISNELMGGMIILIAFTSCVISWISKGGSFSMKTFMFFAVFGVVFIMFTFTNTGADIDPEGYEGFSDLYTSYENFTDALNSPNPASMLVTSFSFLLDFIYFSLLAPVHFINFITSILMNLSAPIGTAFSIFSPIITIGTYALIITKGYEILADKYLEV